MDFIVFVPSGSADALVRIEHALHHIIHRQEHIMATQAELAKALTEIGAQVAKIGTESSATLQKVTDLEKALADSKAAGNDTTPEVDAAVAALKAQVQLVDDLVPDPVPAPAP